MPRIFFEIFGGHSAGRLVPQLFQKGCIFGDEAARGPLGVDEPFRLQLGQRRCMVLGLTPAAAAMSRTESRCPPGG